MRRTLGMLRRWLRRLGFAAVLLVTLAAGGFGVLQTPSGQDWFARAFGDAASSPGVAVEVDGIDGFLPFQMTAKRIRVADDSGVWLSLSNVTFDLSPAELAVGRARVRTLTAEAMDVARLPKAPPSTAPPPSLAGRLKVPSLPLPVAIDRLAIDRITLDPSIIGDKVEASLIGSAAVDGQTVQAILDLHRTDGSAGHLALRLGLSGTPPVLALRLTADESTGALLGHVLHRGDRPPLLVSLTGEGPVAAWHGRLEASAGSLARFDADLNLIGVGEPNITLSGIAAVDRLLPPDIAPLIGTHVPVALRTSVKENGAIALDSLSVELASGTLTGAGVFSQARDTLNGRIRLSVDDLRPFAGMVGRPLEGAVALDVTAQQQTADRIAVQVAGSITRLRSGVPAVDALGGEAITITGSGQRDPAGVLEIDRLTLTGAGASLEASGHFDPATRQLAAKLDADIGQLQSLGVALGTALRGRLTARISAEGPIDHASLRGQIVGADIAAGPALFDRVRLAASIADLAQPRIGVTGEFRGGGLDGNLALDADLDDHAEVAIRHLQVRAADGAADGDLRIDLARLLAGGTLRAKLPDLSRWSRLAGMPLAGSLDIKAGLDTERGQGLALAVNGDRLAAGSGGSRVVVGHIAGSARFSDLLGGPTGKAEASLSNAAFASGSLATARVTLDGARPGRFAFTADAKGKAIDPVNIALGGDIEIAPQGAGIDVRVARLTGSLGADHFQLTRPLRLSKRGADLAMSDLALTLGPGQITGNAARRGQSLSLQLAARNLSLASPGRLAGYRDAGGTVALDATVGGSVATPQGSFKVSGRALRFALPKQPRLPTLALDLDGKWNGREIAFNGHVSGLKGETVELTGTAPLVLRPAPLALSVPPQGRLALRVQGAGELANLSDLLPLGEDRVTGRFALDVSLAGTVGAPAASGSLTISDGRYENFATGAVLTKMKVDLAGDRDRLTLREFSAGDSADGSLGARGSLGLNASAPSAELTATLKHFRIAARDETVVTASGNVAISGTIASPKVTAQLTAEQGDITLPDRLPPSVARLKVIEINRSNPERPAPPSQKAEPAALPAALDLELTVPSRVFVRGRGLDSEWGGRLKITGTSAAPRITGSLSAQRGTFDVLGKSFKITRGRITFDGGANLDPALDIVAEVSSGDVTAQVLVGGLISSPTVTLSSTPVLPQDEILARVLFGRGVGQITAAQGIQVAQAAATLAGGGPGVLDRIRNKIGLDRLVFGSAPSGTASSNLNPAAGGNAASGTAVSGGKYVAEGVYVGATQGLTPQSSKVTVEIEVRPHVTVETDLSQTAGTGIGLNYKYDY
jgi:translocation and assembly module TamB